MPDGPAASGERSKRRLSGHLSVTGPTCVVHEKPKAAGFGPSPDKITVSKRGTFTYPFKATPALTGTIKVMKGANLWAKKNFTVPDSGKVSAKLTLTDQAFKKLKHDGKDTVDVGVKLVDGPYHTTKHHDLILKAP